MTKGIRERIGRDLLVRVLRKSPRRDSAQTRARIGCKDAGEKDGALIAVLPRFPTALIDHLDQRFGGGRGALYNRMLDDLREGILDAIGLRAHGGLRAYGGLHALVPDSLRLLIWLSTARDLPGNRVNLTL